MKNPRGVYEKVPGSNIWWIRYADAAGRIRREIAGPKSAAISLYQKRKTEIRQGKKLPENLRSTVRVSDLTAALRRDYEVNAKKSWDSAERRLRKHIVPFFGTMVANELGTDDIERYVDARRKRGAENATINRELAALKRVFNLARSAKPPKVRDVPAFPHLKENSPRQGFVEDRDYEKLQQQAKENWLKAMLAVAYTFGLRRSELLKLQVRQVDLRRRLVCLDAGSTKNDEARRIKLTKETWGLLGPCVRDKGPEELVFTRSGGKPVLNFRGTWYALCERAGLGRFVDGEASQKKWRGLIFHDLRRSAVRNMVRAGVTEKVAMSLSGHKTRSVFDRYNITSDSDIEQAAEMMERARRRSVRASGERKPGPTDTITSTTARKKIAVNSTIDVSLLPAIA